MIKNPNQLTRLTLLVATFLFLLPQAATGTGGAWTRAEGGYYLKTSLTWYSADQEFGTDGERRAIFSDTVNFRNGAYGSTDFTLYGEYGFTDWLTGVVTTQFKVAVRQAHYVPILRDSTVSTSGLSDIWLGARFRLLDLRDPIAAAVTLAWKAPTGSPFKEIPLGTGVVDYMAAAATGTSFPLPLDLYGYAQLSAGYRIRNAGADEIPYQAEVGVNLSHDFLMIARLDGVYSLADFDSTGAVGNAALRSVVTGDQTFTRIGASAIYAATETIDVSATYDAHIIGRNTLDGTGFTIGIAWKN